MSFLKTKKTQRNQTEKDPVHSITSIIDVFFNIN